jgi:biopolymer transport protein ExbB
MYKFLISFFLCFPFALMAQAPSAADEIAREVGEEAQAAPTIEELTTRLDLQQVIENGGPLVYLLAVMSVLMIALVIYFMFVLRNSRIAPSGFLRETQLTLKTGEMNEVRALCDENKSPVSQLMIAALDYLDRSEDQADPDLLRQVVEGEGVRQVGRLQSQITYLMDIGVIAPMVGLLGTVMGMLQSFSAVALDVTKVKPTELAYGVSQALITTAAGLIVAIPAMIAYSVFRGRLSKLTANLELVAVDMVATLVHRKKV